MQALFDTPDYRERLDAEAMEQGAQPHQMGLAEQAGLGVMRGGAELARGVGLLGGALVTPFGEDTADEYFAAVDDLFGDAADYWTPDPRTTTRAGEIVAGVAEAALPLMLGAGSATPLMVASTGRTAARLSDQGVDGGTTVDAAMLDATAVAVGFAVPAVGRTLARSIALGVATNPAIGAATEGAQRDLLAEAGYTDQAQQFDPWRLEARAVEALLGAAFGGIGWATRADADAALTYRNAADAARRAPGLPADLASVNAHAQAMRESINAMADGRPVDPDLGRARFQARAEPEPAPLVDAFDDYGGGVGEYPAAQAAEPRLGVVHEADGRRVVVTERDAQGRPRRFEVRNGDQVAELEVTGRDAQGRPVEVRPAAGGDAMPWTPGDGEGGPRTLEVIQRGEDGRAQRFRVVKDGQAHTIEVAQRGEDGRAQRFQLVDPEVATRVLEDYPDMVLTRDDGSVVRASDEMARIDMEIDEMKRTYPRILEAAVSCVIRQL